MRKLKGIVCANITPMDASGAVDFESLKRLINHMADTGIHAVYPCGTNGEGILLSMQEHHGVTDVVVEANAGRMAAYIQCACTGWEDTMENVSYACKSGADGVGVMTPIFYKIDDEAMVEYYRQVCRTAGDKPVYLYNIASHTNNDISVKAFAQIVDENPNVMGMKYSNKDIQRIQDYMRTPKTRKPDVLIGADSYILSALAAGCAGEVSGPACVFPKWYVGAYESFMAGDMEKALEYQNKVVAVTRTLKAVPAIPGIKAMLKLQGVIAHDTCRRPFRTLRAEEYKVLDAVLNTYAKD
ncbi:MAG: dihydrodipicolinate synthase family protein [Lachnospiraceae bacterium]|nr:dihydrodipicolinate synthase family protein [Lachnospiraceae bacterium]